MPGPFSEFLNSTAAAPPAPASTPFGDFVAGSGSSLPDPDSVARETDTNAHALAGIALARHAAEQAPPPPPEPDISAFLHGMSPWQAGLEAAAGLDPTGIVPGLIKAGKGIWQTAHPATPADIPGGLNEMFGGVMDAAQIGMAGGVAEAPVKTAVSIGAGMLTQSGVMKGLVRMGMPAGWAEFVGNLAGIVSGVGTHEAMSPKAIEAIKTRIAPVLKARAEQAGPPQQQFTSTGQPVYQAPPEAAQPVAPPAQPVAARPAQAKPAVNLDAKLPPALQGAKPRYSYGPKQFDLNFESDLDRAAYITGQTKLSRADASYLKFAMDATGESEDAVRQHGRNVRHSIKAQAAGAEPGTTLTVPDMARAKFGAKAPAQPVVATVAPIHQPAVQSTLERPGGTSDAGTPGQQPAAAVDAGATRPLDTGRAGKGPEVYGAPPSGSRRLIGKATRVRIAGDRRSIPAHYEIRELDDSEASHNGQTFAGNPRYAPLVNERDYSQAENQQRVVENGSEENFEPDLHINNNPDMANGPTFLDEDSRAIAGNQRHMQLQRVYGRMGAKAREYRQMLHDEAHVFGIDPAGMADMKKPALFRVAEPGALDDLPGGSKWAIRKTNVTGTADLSASERAAADAGQMSPGMIGHIAGAIEDAGLDATLNDALTGKSGTVIVNRLIAEGFFSEQERPGLMDGKTGVLTQRAKDRISKALLGQFFRDSDQIARTPPSIKNKLERVAAPLAKVAGNPEWDITPDVREAIDLIEYAGAHGIRNLGDVVSQTGMFGEAPKWSDGAVKLAEMLRDGKPNEVVSAFRKYVNSKEPSMFGESTPAEAFADAFGAEKPPAKPTPGGSSSSVPPKPPGGPVYMGSGLGAFEPFLRESIEDMRALAATRHAAIAELKKTDPSVPERHWGERVRHFFTSVRDLWAARANQGIAQVRKLTYSSRNRRTGVDGLAEAITIAREFRGKPEELKSILGGYHPDLGKLPDTATLDRVLNRIQALRPAIERALAPMDPAMKAVDAFYTEMATITGDEGNRVGVLHSQWNPETYVPHVLNPKGEGQYPGLRKAVGRALGGNIGKYFGYAQERNYPTLLHALMADVIPKTMNVHDAFTLQQDHFARARATRMLEDQLRETGIGSYAVAAKAPDGWVQLAGHATEFQQIVPYPTGELDAEGHDVLDVATKHLFVPKFISDGLKPITAPDYTVEIKGKDLIRSTQAATKAAQLGLSLFHATTENYMALANMGPRGWIKALRADRDSPEFLLGERILIRAGGTTAIQGNTVEAYKAMSPGSIPTYQDIWRKAPAVRQMDELAHAISDFTFNNMQRRFKVTDFMLHRAAWMEKHPNAMQGEIRDAERSMAKEVNAIYGGLHWENIGTNKATVEIARALMLAPDWTISNFWNAKYAFEKGPAGNMARMFWMRTLVGGVVATQAASLMFSRKFSPRPTMVYMGKDPGGLDVYQNLFFKGAPGDMTNLVTNVYDYGLQGIAKTLAGKGSPTVRTGLQLITNEDFLHHTIAPKEMNPAVSSARTVWSATKSLAPIPLSLTNQVDMLFGPESHQYTWPEPLTTMFAGNPPSHVAPPGTHMSPEGLRPNAIREKNTALEQLRTGKVYKARAR